MGSPSPALPRREGEAGAVEPLPNPPRWGGAPPQPSPVGEGVARAMEPLPSPPRWGRERLARWEGPSPALPKGRERLARWGAQSRRV